MVFLSFNTSVTPAEEVGDDDEFDDDGEGEELPLRYRWVIWQQVAASGGRGMQYSEATSDISSCETVEAFWKIWNRLPQPSALLSQRMVSKGSGVAVDALMVFRDGITPQWEDPVNASGGHFQFQFKGSLGGGQIDEHWNNLVLGIIGATIEPVDMITGVRLVDKLATGPGANKGGKGGGSHLRIEVWFTHAKDLRMVQALQRNVERCLATRTLEGRIGTVPRAELKNHRMTRHQ